MQRLSRLACLFAFLAAPALADDDCPNWLYPKDVIRTTDFRGVPLDELLTNDVLGVRLRFAYGYVWPSRGRRSRGMVVKTNGGWHLRFWMPDGRYTEDAPHPDYRLCEAGRPRATAEQYVVTVSDFWPFVDARGDEFVFPQADFERTIAWRTEEPRVIDSAFGLLRLDWVDPAYNYDLFRNPDGAPFEIYMRCTEPPDRPGNPGCHARYWEPETHYYVKFDFPAERVADWRAIVERMRELLIGWNAAAQED